MRQLQQEGTLPYEYRPHKLSGNYADCWECHLGGRNSDWIMVWQKDEDRLTLLMLRTGSHSDIF